MKTLSFLAFVCVVLMSACTNQQTQTKQLPANPHEEFVKKFFTYFNQHDWQNMAGMYTESADFKDPSLGQSIVKQTRAQTIKKYTELQQQFPNIHDEIIRIYPSDDTHIIVEFVSTGTAQDGTSFSLPICTILTIENGFITKDFTYYDNSGNK